MSEPQAINIYCDESCHLENDGKTAMVLGAVWCPRENAKGITRSIREIKKKHGFNELFEIKWTKVSPAKVDFYSELLEYFFGNINLHYRALIVPDKSKLRHDVYNQDHDLFYYKMYFEMLKILLSPDKRYKIYLDIKDTHSTIKTNKLRGVLCNAKLDFDRKIIHPISVVRSEHVEQIQLADFLTGIISYKSRRLSGSPAKLQLIQKMENLSKYSLTRSTLLREEKVNLLFWTAREADE